MKKVVIVLSLVLIIFSFAACDNTDKVFEVYSDFLGSYSRKSAVDDLLSDILGARTWPDGRVDYTIENTSDFSPSGVTRLWAKYNPLERGRDYNSVTVTEAKGKLSGTYIDDRNNSVVMDGISISFTYDITDDDTTEKIEEGRSGTLEISGTTTIEEKDGLIRESGRVTVNGKTFSLSAVIDNKNGVMKEAVINGKKVDVRFFNAFMDMFR